MVSSFLEKAVIQECRKQGGAEAGNGLCFAGWLCNPFDAMDVVFCDGGEMVVSVPLWRNREETDVWREWPDRDASGDRWLVGVLESVRKVSV